MSMYYGDSSGKAKKVILAGVPGPVGPQGGVGPQGPAGPAGIGSRNSRFIIGTSTAGWTADDCDYLCDGAADDVEINAAIQALPATGGQILILDGTYIITAPITIDKNNATLRGNGTATILQRNWNSVAEEGVITITAANGGVTIQNIQIDGNAENYTNTKYGIYVISNSNNIINNICNNNDSHGIYLSGSNNTVAGNTCNNNDSHGIYLSGSNNTVTGNTCDNNSATGIYLASSSNNNTVTGNTSNNNNHGIYLYSSSNNTITGNTCNNNNSRGIFLASSSNNNTVTGNTYNNNNNHGIYVATSNNNTVTGNTCNNNFNSGICLYSSSNNTVTGNTCIRGTGQSSDYTLSQHTINVANATSSKNLIVGNNIMGKNYANAGTDNTWANNKYN